MKQILLGLALLVIVLACLWPGKGPAYPPGVLAPEEPEQRLIASGEPWQVKEHTITPLADYHIRARVLGTERYWFDSSSALSPIDLFVGWGRMSDQAILDQLSYWARRRGAEYRPKGHDWPIPFDEINSHSANMHMIPADAEVLHALRNIQTGDIVDMRGYLIEARTSRGWRWRSSLSRTDTGEGACEVMWVTHLSTGRKE
jgi:hypothetical protein